MKLSLALCAVAACLAGCGSSTVFTPKSAYPPDPWVKNYTDPDDCIGGEALSPIKFDLPDYPKGAFRKGRQGWAMLRLDVDADGETQSVRVEKSVPSGAFDSASVKAVENWTFRRPETPLKDCRVLLRYQAGKVHLGES